jgi:hypothetical protein
MQIKLFNILIWHLGNRMCHTLTKQLENEGIQTLNMVFPLLHHWDLSSLIELCRWPNSYKMKVFRHWGVFSFRSLDLSSLIELCRSNYHVITVSEWLLFNANSAILQLWTYCNIIHFIDSLQEHLITNLMAQNQENVSEWGEHVYPQTVVSVSHLW